MSELEEKPKTKEAKIKQLDVLFVAWLMATGASIGSLYLSQVLELAPCEMCWWQRIMMYPIALILTVAMVRKDIKAYLYAWPMALLGMFFAAYHYYLQFWADSSAAQCSTEASCSSTYYKVFGFMTIPFGAFFFFLALNIMFAYLYKRQKKD